MSRLTAVAFAVVVLAVGLAKPVAAAAKRKLAVIDLTIDGDAEPKLRTQLGKSIVGGLTAAGWTVIPRDTVTRQLKDTPDLLGCFTSTCLGRIAEKVGATRFVRVRVLAEGASYTVVLELLSADSTNGPVGHLERACAPCTLAEVNDLASRAASELKEGVTDKRILHIESDPPGAMITVDGSPIGVAPQDFTTTPGKHTVQVTMVGCSPLREDVDLTVSTADRPTVKHFKLVTIAQPTPPPAPAPALTDEQRPVTDVGYLPPRDDGPPRRFGKWTWVTGGSGAAFLITGIVTWSQDGKHTGCPPGGGRCAHVYETTAGGLVLTGLGLGLIGTAAWMFIHDRGLPDDSSTQVGVAPTPGGGMAVVSGHF